MRMEVSCQSRAAKNVVIVGCGGQAKVIADIVLQSGDSIKGFLASEKSCSFFMGMPILGTDEDYDKFLDCYFVIGIGDSNVRIRLAEFMTDAKWYTAIHPSAVVSNFDTYVGLGTVVMANAVINPGTRVGNHCIINTTAVVEHDCVIDDFSHISVGAKLAGGVHVGRQVHVGIGASVREQITICDKCTVGAGAVVVNDLKLSDKYIGVPAKRLEK